MWLYFSVIINFSIYVNEHHNYIYIGLEIKIKFY